MTKSLKILGLRCNLNPSTLCKLETSGFNGKENDKDWGGDLIQDYGFRLYNPRYGKFLSVDPLMKQYPMLTPYQFASNSPIAGVDLDGLEFSISTTADGVTYLNAHFKVVNSSNLSNENLDLLFSKGVKSKYLELMNKTYNGDRFRGWFTYEIVEEEVEAGEYFIEIVEPKDEKLSFIDKYGNKDYAKGKVHEIGGNSLTFSTAGITDKDFGSKSNIEIANLLFNQGKEFSDGVNHELGHLLTLLHPWDLQEKNDIGTFTQILSLRNLYKEAKDDSTSKAADLIRNNLMNSPGNPNFMLQPVGNESNTLTDDQFGKVYQNITERNKKIRKKTKGNE